MSNTLFTKRPLALVIATAALISQGAIAAESKPQDLEEMVVVGSRIEVPLRQQATAISVVTQQAIENRGFSNLADVLRDQTAIHVSNSGGAGKATALRIRGEESYRTKVLVDGIDISDPTGTQVGPQIQHISSAGIGRIEILRGPQGMAYGADAGGIISIRSARPEQGLGGELRLEAGRYGHQQISAALGGANSVGDFSLSVTDTETDGFNASSADVLGDDDGYENDTLHFNAGVNLNENWRMEVTLRDVDAFTQFDSTFEPGSPNSSFSQKNQRIAANYQDDTWTHQLAYSNNDVSRDFSSGTQFSGSIEQLQYLGSVELGQANTLVLGLDHEEQEDEGNQASREQLGAHVEWQNQSLDNLFLTAGLRFDDNEDFGKHLSLRFSAAYLIPLEGGELKLKSTLGNGFRAPSLAELALNQRAAAGGLGEENSRGADIGIEWLGDNGLKLNAVYFYQTVENQVEFYLDYSLPTYGFYTQGDGESVSQGVELSLQQSFGEALTVRANATYNDAEDSAGDQRRRRPRVLANIGFDYSLLDGEVQLSGNWRRSAGQSDRSIDLDNYDVLDLRLAWNINEHVEIYSRLENALDEKYQELSGYNTARAAAYAGVKLKF